MSSARPRASTELALFGGSALVVREQHRRWPLIDAEWQKATARVLECGILSGAYAPESRAFEEEFAEFVGAKHALLSHSGTSALMLALAAAGVGPGHEVIVPAYTFVATPMAVALLGAVPIFCDVDARTGLMDPALADELVSPRTRALFPVHVHGCPADLDRLGAIAKQHGLALVEDAAQAHGATYGRKPVGALFAGGGFSLQSSKNLAAGEGGVYVTNSTDAAELAHSIRSFGQNVRLEDAAHFDRARPLDGSRPLESVRLGAMYRGNELMAAIARVQLARLPELTARCQENATRLGRRLAELPGVLPPLVADDRTSVHHKFRVAFDLEQAGIEPGAIAARAFRDLLARALRAEGIEAVLWEVAPQPRQRVFSDLLDTRVASADVERVRKNYRADYPATQHLLDTSLLLFSHSAPLIAQNASLVDAYADAFEKVWQHRRDLVERAPLA